MICREKIVLKKSGTLYKLDGGEVLKLVRMKLQRNNITFLWLLYILNDV
jgi:hypothetical protein